jgi:hypothetical protein
MPFRPLALLLLGVYAAAAQPAGMATHASMADFGRDALEDGALKTLLTAHRPALLAGAIHPDGGYGSGVLFPADRDMAERAHWGDFTIAFLQHLRETGCSGEVRRALVRRPPLGLIDMNLIGDRCGHLIAFAFGNAAHGLTDETWDAQFEPEVRNRGETPNSVEFLLDKLPGFPAALAEPLIALYGATPMNAIEFAMDMVNIVERGLILDAPTLVFPPTADLVEVYRRNRPEQGVNAAMVERGNLLARSLVQVESLAAPLAAPLMRRQMPWGAANYYTAPGGVVQSGYAVAGMYRQLWDLLTGDPALPLPPAVIGNYPGHGAVDVKLEPARESWTQHRWLHLFFSASMDPASLEAPGTICLFDEGGRRVKGVVEPGSWQREFAHAVKFRLQETLLPGHRYTVVVTTRARDYRGVPLEHPHSFSFATAR